MNLKGTLRRTLALLLVLIFALSNMGLAEMADGMAELIPEAVESAAEETPAEEAAPAEEQAEAPVVAVDAYQIDETSLFANAAVENYDGELAYQWEIAGEDGAWTAIDGATDSVYTTEAEDRLEQSYRCVVTAGDVAAASDATGFDPDAYDYGIATVAADEPVMVDESAELATLDTNGDGNLSSATVEIKDSEGTSVVTSPIAVDDPAEYSLTLTANVSDYTSDFDGEGPETLKYTWDLGEAAALLTEDGSTSEKHTHGESAETACKDTITLKLQEAAQTTLTNNKTLELKGINVSVSSSVDASPDKAGKSATLDVTLVKKVGAATFQAAPITITPVETEAEDAYKQGSNTKLKVAVTGYDAYKPYITYAVLNLSDDNNETASMGTEIGETGEDTITIGESLTVEQPTTYYVKATLDKACTGDSDAVTTAKTPTFTVKPAANTITLAPTDKTIVADDETAFTVTATLAPETSYTDDIEWTVSTEEELDAATYVSVEPNDDPTQATVKLLPAAVKNAPPAALARQNSLTITEF